MAKCECCGREMLKAKGCKPFPVPVKGVGYVARIPCYEDVCHDCGAHFGCYHHPGCDNEYCPVCGMQMGGCDCIYFIDVSLSDAEVEKQLSELEAKQKAGISNWIERTEAEISIRDYKRLQQDRKNGLFGGAKDGTVL